MASPIQQAMEAKANLAMGIIEYEIDLFFENKCKSNFSMFKYLNQLGYKPKVVRIMIADYEKSIAEVTSTDPDLVEGYSHLSDAQKKKYVAFLQKIVDDGNRYISDPKNVKKWERESARRSLIRKLNKTKNKYDIN